MSIQSVILFIVIIVPFSLTIHEIGHAIGAKLRRADGIQLRIGSGKEIFRFTLFGVRVIFCVFYIFGTYTATVREIPFSRRERIFITVMGPLVNGLIAALLYMTYLFLYDNYLLFVAMLFNLWLFLINLIPYRIGERQSDGYIIYQIIRPRKSKDQSIS